MTHAIGKPVPLPYVDEDDLLAVVDDLGAGYFPASRLYEWHVAILEGEGREPVSKTRFGLALKQAGWHSSVRRIGGTATRCWLVTKPWVRRAAAKFGTRLPEGY